MPHIHTEPGQMDQTATVYVALLSPNEEPKMLLHTHRKLGVLLPFGGHVELNETVWQAAAHELLEESGYTLAELSVMQPPLRITSSGKSVVHPQPVLLNTHTFETVPGHYHADAVFLCTAVNTPLLKPGQDESADIQALTRSEIVSLTDSEMYADTRNTAIALLDDFIAAWEPVPATNFSLEVPQN